MQQSWDLSLSWFSSLSLNILSCISSLSVHSKVSQLPFLNVSCSYFSTIYCMFNSLPPLQQWDWTWWWTKGPAWSAHGCVRRLRHVIAWWGVLSGSPWLLHVFTGWLALILHKRTGSIAESCGMLLWNAPQHHFKGAFRAHVRRTFVAAVEELWKSIKQGSNAYMCGGWRVHFIRRGTWKEAEKQICSQTSRIT